MDYLAHAKKMKVLADAKRLCIVDMLSCGEMCACEILARFHVTQPTLSHDMKLLIAAGFVKARPEGKWMYYSLNEDNIRAFYASLGQALFPSEACICRRKEEEP